MTTSHTAFAAALASAEGQPQKSFDALYALADATVGAKMFTVLVFDFPNGIARRVYSSIESIYPTGVTDPIGDTIWEKTLIGDKQPLVLNDPKAMATLLPNVDELTAHGFAAMLNVPVVVAGQPLAALNMLAESGHYTPERIEAAKALGPAAAAILLSMPSVAN